MFTFAYPALYNEIIYNKLTERSAVKKSRYAIHSDDITLGDIQGFMSCQNGLFERRVSHFNRKFLGKDGDFTEIVFSTNNKDGKMMVCARCFFEKTSDGKTHYRFYLFTTNDPLAADNFNTYRQAITNERALGKCVEQASFCEDKVRLALTGMTMEEIHREFMTSSFTKSNTLREVLGKELTSGVSTAKPLDRELDPKQAKAELEARMAEELGLLRQIVASMTAGEFFLLYKAWGDSKLHMQTDLSPFLAYKSVGRQVALNKRAMDRWSELAFLSVMSRRWEALMGSPMEARLFCTTPDFFFEASKDDWIWAIHLEDKKLDDAWFETTAGHDFLFAKMEQAAAQQYYWLETLKTYCSAGTEGSDTLAFEFLTTGTAGLKGKLGLTQTLMKEMWTGNITFSSRLVNMLKEAYKEYGIELCDFRPPCLVPSNLGNDFEILMNIGGDTMVH
jgi:hypothetical protein